MKTSASARVIVLDRDGVINHDSKNFIKSADEFKCLPGSIEALSRLNHMGWKLVIASNQSGIGRGLFNKEDLDAMHAKLHDQLALSGATVAGIFYCPHKPEDGCACRKPKTGLLLEAERSLGLSLVGVPFIGDSLRDLQAARAHGCRPILVRTGNGKLVEPDLASQEWSHVAIYDNLSDVAEALLTTQ